MIIEKKYVTLRNKIRTGMEQVKMLGALVGDIIGSVYEFCNTKSTDLMYHVKGACQRPSLLFWKVTRLRR